MQAGDIAFTRLNTDGKDGFSFVALVDIAAGQKILFSSLYWDSPNWRNDNSGQSTGGIIEWTAGADVTAGGVVNIDTSAVGATTSLVANTGTVQIATPPAGMLGNLEWNLRTAQDSVLAFTGTADAPAFIAGVTSEYNSTYDLATGWADTGKMQSYGVSDSQLPTTLTNGTNALAVFNSLNANEFDNVRYKSSALASGTKAQLLASINNWANWEFDDTNEYALPATSTFTVADANAAPTLTTISALPNAIEDTAYTITYAALLAASNYTDSDAGDPKSFRVEAVSSGTLTKGGIAISPGITLLGTGESLVWNPAANANGSGLNAFTVKAWDGKAASASSVQVKVNATAVNDAPVLSGNGALPSINEDASNPAGAALNTLGIAASDSADAGSITGYTIISNAANAATQGAWQYSDNGGANWHAIGAVSDGSALALSSATLVRFVPVANYNGNPGALGIRALDDSYVSGFSNGAAAELRFTINTNTNGNSTAISAATASIGTSVTTVNDSPAIANLGGDMLTTAASASAVIVDQGTATAVTDVDNAHFNGGTLTVSFVVRTDGAGDVLSIQTGAGLSLSSGTLVGSSVAVGGTVIGAIAAAGTGTGTDKLIVSLNTDATPARVATLLQNITYDNTAGSPTAGDRIVRFVLTDGSGGGSGNVDTTITVTTNAAPVVTTPTAISLLDTAAADTFTVQTGTLSATDADGIASYGVSGGTTGGSFVDGGVTYDVSKTGTYGTLYLVSTGVDEGKYAYAPNGSAINALAGGSPSETFTFTATDANAIPASSQATLTVNVTGVNDTPTDLGLSKASVNQSAGANAQVGILGSTDVDTGETYTYAQVTGSGDNDNASFNILGNSLRASTVLAAGIYSTRVRTTDSGGLTSTKAFAITVVDDVSPGTVSVAVPPGGTYALGQHLDFTVNFSESMVVTGTPRIALVVGATTVYADYLSGSGSTGLVFRATVQTGWLDTDGISVQVLQLNGGTLRDTAGNNAVLTLNSLGSTAGVNVDGAAPSDPPPATPPSTTIDGVPVVTEPGPGGSTIVTIPVVVPTRADTPGTTSPLADIPIVKAPDGHTIVQVSVPTGVGLQAEGLTTSSTGSAALAELGFRIERIAGNSTELTNAGQVFYATLAPNEPLSVQILKPTIGAGYDGSQPLVITGSNSPADGKQAVIIDARSLPPGTVIQVDNIEFIAVVGNVRIIGGAGQNMASGDNGTQYIVLGPDDDVIHGGGGNDTVGSEAGDDQVYGDAGDDIVFGGAGNDLLSGGTGSDRLNGGTGFDVAVQEGKKTDYTITLEGAGIKLTHTATGVSDWLVDVEQVRFETGPSLAVAHSAAEEAAAYLFPKWIGRDLNQGEGAAIQTLTGKTALEVATLFAQLFPEQSAGKTGAQLLEGMASAGAIRVDAVRDVMVSGDAGNNTIIPPLGLARYVDGGAGIDTVVIPATLGQTYMQANGGGTFTLQRLTDGAMLDVSNVERITFNNTKLALDLSGNAGQAAKLLGALAGPSSLANKGLLGEAIRALDAGMSAKDLAAIGLQALGASTPAQVAQLLFTNLMGRAATQTELQPLVDLLGQGLSTADAAVQVGNMDLNATRIDLVGLTAKGIEFA